MELTARLTSLGQASEGVNKQGNPWRKAMHQYQLENLRKNAEPQP